MKNLQHLKKTLDIIISIQELKDALEKGTQINDPEIPMNCKELLEFVNKVLQHWEKDFLDLATRQDEVLDY
jgi:hypothetical protein